MQTYYVFYVYAVEVYNVKQHISQLLKWPINF